MNNCCEKWHIESVEKTLCLQDGKSEEYFVSNQRIKYCPECGSSLKDDGIEKQYCECEYPTLSYKLGFSYCGTCGIHLPPSVLVPERPHIKKFDLSYINKYYNEAKDRKEDYLWSCFIDIRTKITEIIDILNKERGR